jgi:hypothetical protein
VDPIELEEFAAHLSELPGVDDLDLRPTTGSLVVEHPDLDWEDLLEGFRRIGGVIVDPYGENSGRPDTLAPVRATFDRVDGLLTAVSAGGVDLRMLYFVVLIGLALSQMLRGQIMVPAITLLTWALELALRKGVDSDSGGDAAAE